VCLVALALVPSHRTFRLRRFLFLYKVLMTMPPARALPPI